MYLSFHSVMNGPHLVEHARHEASNARTLLRARAVLNRVERVRDRAQGVRVKLLYRLPSLCNGKLQARQMIRPYALDIAKLRTNCYSTII